MAKIHSVWLCLKEMAFDLALGKQQQPQADPGTTSQVEQLGLAKTLSTVSHPPHFLPQPNDAGCSPGTQERLGCQALFSVTNATCQTFQGVGDIHRRSPYARGWSLRVVT
jgi:hypothetical protein